MLGKGYTGIFCTIFCNCPANLKLSQNKKLKINVPTEQQQQKNF